MIPKKIHYCWFGKSDKGELFYKCYKSWKKFFPEYEIIEWNERNFDVNVNKYIKEAYKEKKYAFVSDYVRLKVLYENGGIYFDTDVEVIKRFPEEILINGYFAKETYNEIATGLGFAVDKENKIIKYMMDDYENISFYNDDGKLDLTPCTKRNTYSLIKRGYKIDKSTQKIDNIKIYDPEYFCGYDVFNNNYCITSNTITVHHYAASWLPWKKSFMKFIREQISSLIGIENYKKIRLFFKKNKSEKM